MHINVMLLINNQSIRMKERRLALVETKFCKIRLHIQLASHRTTKLILPSHIQQGCTLIETQMSELNELSIWVFPDILEFLMILDRIDWVKIFA